MAGAIHIGTSGWHYPHWRGLYYPADLPPPQWLSHYAADLSSVEINNSFYRLPEAAALLHWRDQTPANFVFSVKASRTITHFKKLRDCDESLTALLDRVRLLGGKLGPLLFQLPPRWHVNRQRLEQFLQSLPETQRCAFEFRDPSWEDADVFELLKKYNRAFCIFELDRHRSPEACTADFVYVRLHGPAGPYAGNYPATALRGWADRILTWNRRDIDVYLYFDNDERAYAVKNALLLRKLLATEA